MKKFLALIFVLVCLFLTKQDSIFNHFDLPSDTIYYLYSDKAYEYENSVCVGNSYIIQDNKPISYGDRKVYGESVSFEGDIEYFENLLNTLNFEYIYENTSDVIIVSGYIPSLKYFLYVNGQKKNIQLAFNEGIISIGTPLILGSY